MIGHTDRTTDRQTDRQIDGQADKVIPILPPPPTSCIYTGDVGGGGIKRLAQITTSASVKMQSLNLNLPPTFLSMVFCQHTYTSLVAKI